MVLQGPCFFVLLLYGLLLSCSHTSHLVHLDRIWDRYKYVLNLLLFVWFWAEIFAMYQLLIFIVAREEGGRCRMYCSAFNYAI